MFRLPSWYPPPDEDGGIVVMQAPIIDRRLIDPSDGSTDDVLANALIDAYGASISQFVNAGRRNYALGVAQIQNRSLELPGLGINHQVQQRREIVTLTPRPRQINSLLDLNFDGYVAWVHVGANAWPKKSWPTYNMYVNGFAVLSDITPDDTKTSVYFIMFGGTSLRCQSLNDSTNPFKPGIQEPGNQTGHPTKLTNPIVPKRKQVAALGSIPAHDDLLGYFIFNWGDQFNPARQSGNTSAPPIMLQGLQFATPAKSPLTANGFNNATLHVTQNVGTMGYQGPGDYLIAEFYDRKQMRFVEQSWKYAKSAGQTILVNDHPLYWDNGIDFEGLADLGLDFDLTPRKDYTSLPVPPAILGVRGASGNSSMVPPIDAAYVAARLAWQTLYNNYILHVWTPAYNAVLAADSTLQTDLTNVVAQAQGYANANPPTSTLGFWARSLLGAVTNMDTAITDAVVAPDSPTFAAYEAAIPALNSNIATVVGLTSNTALIAAQGSLAVDQPLMTSALSALQSATAGIPAPPPLAPSYNGLDLGNFSRRKITVSGGDWSFGDWTPA